MSGPEVVEGAEGARVMYGGPDCPHSPMPHRELWGDTPHLVIPLEPDRD